MRNGEEFLLKRLLDEMGWEREKGSHIEFVGRDSYAASVPMELVEKHDVVIAYQMNGEKLPIDHGAPLRAVVPGVVAARSVKWLSEINVRNMESESPWQRHDYKVLPSSVEKPTVKDYESVSSIQEIPVQSAITNLSCEGGESCCCMGYAFSGGGKEIQRVEISIDGGETWYDAEIKEKGIDGYSWTLWQMRLNGVHEGGNVICRATDSEGTVQPGNVKSIWNCRGLLNSSL